MGAPNVNDMTKGNISTAVLGNAAAAVAEFMKEYQIYLNVFLAFVVVTLVIIFIINAVKLATAADNAVKRQMAIHGIMVTGICIGIMGSFGLIAGILVAFLFS